MPRDNNNSRLVAEMDAKGPIAFNTEIADVFVEDNDDSQKYEGNAYYDSTAGVMEISVSGEGDDPNNDPDPNDDPDPNNDSDPNDNSDPNDDPNSDPNDDPNSDEPNDNQLGDDEDFDEDKYKDYSEAAIIQEALKVKRPDLFKDKDVDKDLDWSNFTENIDEYIAERLETGQKHIVERLGKSEQYVKFLIEGGDPKTLQESLSNVKHTQLDLEQATDSEKEKVVIAMYTDLNNIEPSEAKSLVETIKLSGSLDAKAKTAQEKFISNEKSILNQDIKRRELEQIQAQNQRKEVVDNMNNIIDNGKILGLEISENEKTELKDMFLKPTEIREVSDGKGGKISKKFTKYQILEAEFKDSLEMQIAFGKLLKDGFDFKSIKDQAKNERDHDILNVLEGRNTKRRGKKSNNRNYKNAYYASSAEYDA